jgi:excisionase family DNA binding protein
MATPSAFDDLPAALLTPGEVAELLRTSRKAVYALIQRRQMPGVIRIGRRLLIRRRDLLHWLDHTCTPSSRR